MSALGPLNVNNCVSEEVAFKDKKKYISSKNKPIYRFFATCLIQTSIVVSPGAALTVLLLYMYEKYGFIHECRNS